VTVLKLQNKFKYLRGNDSYPHMIPLPQNNSGQWLEFKRQWDTQQTTVFRQLGMIGITALLLMLLLLLLLF